MNIGAIIGGALGGLVFSTLIVVLFIVNIKRYTVMFFYSLNISYFKSCNVPNNMW